ncbi:hypothetical protein CSA37_05230 [Candidatus Fermentibacteria bacterium]|nr:MAG: hypothetical protein CSA37_05230 [Candidatus Fermentibacteria bacterium]
MKSVLLMILLLSAAAVAQTTSSLTVEEVFSVDTPEEMEAALADGYPMLWLEELLNDKSIPEEDRYWLDCRVRALIAQEFHRFYSEDGVPIEVEADKIRYGESYWQEHFIIDLPGELLPGERNPETNLWNESGFVYNRFGEKTGDLALIDPIMELSRDGTCAALIASSEDDVPEFEAGYLFLLNSDEGSFSMYSEKLYFPECSISPLGDYTVVSRQTGADSPNPLSLFDSRANLLWTLSTKANIPAGVNPCISPEGNYCLIASAEGNTAPWTRYCQLFSIPDGEEISVSTSELSSKLSWSPNGEYYFTGSDYLSILNGSVVWTVKEHDICDRYILGQYCSNNGTLFAATYSVQGSRRTPFELFFMNSVIFRAEAGYGNVVRLSPDGCFGMTGPLEYGPIRFPFTIWQIGGE